MNLDWLQVCAEGQTTPCVAPIQLAYLVALLVGAVLLVVIARRARDLTTATLSLMAVAIAINITVGSIAVFLRLPIYLDSIGTVLVGALAGPWAGALTGILSNLIWSILPIPGGAGPIAAFFAPVAGVIGLMAGFWANRGRLPDPHRTTPGSVASWPWRRGSSARPSRSSSSSATIGIPDLAPTDDDALLANQTQFVLMALGFVAGRRGRRLAGRADRLRLQGRRPTDQAVSPGLPRRSPRSCSSSGSSGCCSARPATSRPWTACSTTARPDDFLGGANLTSLAIADPAGLIGALVVALLVGAGALAWARRGDNARLFPVWVGGLTTGLVAAMISAPIAAGVFGGVTGGGTDALVALFRTLGLSVFQSAFAQGLTSDPLDKTISYTIVFLILGALPITVRTMYSRGETTVAE